MAIFDSRITIKTRRGLTPVKCANACGAGRSGRILQASTNVAVFDARLKGEAYASGNEEKYTAGFDVKCSTSLS